MKRASTYVCRRLSEPSTWLGVGSLATVFGWSWAPEHWMVISQAGMGIGGLMAAILSES